jgi:lipid A 3-O-deacylase
MTKKIAASKGNRSKKSVNRKTAKVPGVPASASIGPEIIASIGIVLAVACLLMAASAYAGEISPISANSASEKPVVITGDPGIWLNGAGNGFRAGTHVIGLGVTATRGLLMLGGGERHHLALGSLSYGRMIGGLKKADRWYGGNWSLQVELFGGSQIDSPNAAYAVGLTPHLRYHFKTATRLVPFIDVGVGVSLTDIGAPDLGGVFQFNTQAGAGVHWFVKDDVAVTFEGRYFHISSAGLSMPNDGVNTAGVFLGINWFF